MKRDKTGRFTTSWNSERKQGVNLSLTQTAWQLLEQQAQQQGVSRSELVERYARSLSLISISTAATCKNGQEVSDAQFVATDQAVDSLLREQEFLQVLLDTVQAGIVACDANGELKLFNQTARVFHGLPEQPLQPDQWADYYDLYLPNGRTRMRTEDIPLFRALQGEPVHQVEMMIVPKGGIARTLLANGQEIVDRNGKKLGAVVVMHDITDRQQIESVLRDREAQLNSIFQTIPNGIVILDRSGQFIAANSAAEDILKLTRSDITGRAYNDSAWAITTVEGAPFPEADLPFVRVMQTGKPVYGVEHTVTHPDGTRIILSVNASPLFNAEGKIVNVVGALTDITDRKRAEVEQAKRIQEQAARLVAESAQRQSAFLAEVSAVLSSSLEYEQTLQSVADLAIPRFADWCSVDLLNDDHTISRVAVAHTNPEKVKFAWELVQRFPRHLDDGYGISQVIKSGKSEIAPEITDEQLTAAIKNEEYLQILRGLSLKSCIVAPLEARGRVLGSITFVYSESDRHYSHTDLILAEDLARRAAIAIDNARLFEAAQQARQAAEKAADRTARLQAITAALSESLTPHQVADVIVAQSMAALEADAALVALLTDDQTELEIIKAVGYHADIVESWRRFPITTDAPLAETVRTGVPAWTETKAERLARYPHLVETYNRYEFNSWLALPLIIEGKSIGAFSFSFREYKQLNQDDRDFILAVSRQCAQAISRAQAYEAERKARADSEAANRVKDEFLAVLSHELRSPLNPILGWSRLLQTKKLEDAKVAQALKTIERNARLQAELIEDLLDVSRILRGKLSLNVASVNLAAIIEAAIETVRLAAEAKSIQIETQFPTKTGQVLGDSSRLQQIVWNLLSNAVKFTPESGKVNVQLDCSSSHAQIIVRDTGKGITPDFLPHVFDYFRQADSTTTRKFGGLGLGLAIVRQLVELHGGTIHAESPGEGQGATFIVQLPLMTAVPLLHQNVSPSASFVSLNGIKVLVVDDDADALDYVAFLLEEEGVSVMTTTTAPEALATLHQFQPNILLSDIGMPDMDGYMLMQQVRSLLPEQGGKIPAIALTAYAGEYDQRQALKVGFQKHIPKPVEPEVLIKAISELIGLNN